MIFLLDVNVLIALGDPAHPHAEAAMRFFTDQAVRQGWASCPLTENGFIRIVGAASYPGAPGTTADARTILKTILAAPGHQFWPDDLSLTDSHRFPRLPNSQALTDLYLLGLAVKRGGGLATLDSGIDPSLIPGGASAYVVIPPA